MEVKRLLKRTSQRLSRSGTSFKNNIPLGAMLETPASLLIAEEIAKHVDFLSIGTNDLIQYLLGIDRTNRDVAYLYEPLHPSVLRSIKIAIRAGNKTNTPITLCGEMASDLHNIPVLLGLGLRSLSMNRNAIAPAKSLIRRLHLGDCINLANGLLQQSETESIKKDVQHFLHEKLLASEHPWLHPTQL